MQGPQHRHPVPASCPTPTCFLTWIPIRVMCQRVQGCPPNYLGGLRQSHPGPGCPAAEGKPAWLRAQEARLQEAWKVRGSISSVGLEGCRVKFRVECCCQGWSKAEAAGCRARKIKEAALRFPGEAKGHLASTGTPWEPHSPSRLSAVGAGGSGPLSPEERAEPPPSPSMLMHSHVPRPRATDTPAGVPNGCKPQTRRSRLSALPPLCSDWLGCLG